MTPYSMGHFKVILFALFILLTFPASMAGQILKPAGWEIHVVKKGDYTILEFEVQLDNTWQLYSSVQEYAPGKGPIAATFEFEPNDSYRLIGKLKPIGFKTKYEEIWGFNINYAEGSAKFNQRVKLLSDKAIVKGTISYQTCTITTGQCVNGQEDFEFVINR